MKHQREECFGADDDYDLEEELPDYPEPTKWGMFTTNDIVLFIFTFFFFMFSSYTHLPSGLVEGPCISQHIQGT